MNRIPIQSKDQLLAEFTEKQLDDARTAISKARMRIITSNPFFSHLVLRLPPKAATTGVIPTAATDGNLILYNPEFMLKLDPVQVQGVLMHELMHCILDHQGRAKGKHPIIWNLACDYVINPILMDDFGASLPTNTLRNDEFAGMNAEQVYARLLANTTFVQMPMPGSGGRGGDQDGGKSGGGGGDQDGDKSGGSGKQTIEDLEKQLGEQTVQGGVLPTGSIGNSEGNEGVNTPQNNWPGIAAAAANAVRQQGKHLPDFVARSMNLDMKPDNAWITALYQYFQPAKIDQSWKRQDRRFISQGIYLPALAGEQIEHAVVVVDTSGSISEPEYAAFQGVILDVVRHTTPKALTIAWADTAIRKVVRFNEGDYPIRKFPQGAGGGGTSFVEPIEKAKSIGDTDPTVLVYLTDLYGEFPDKPPGFPVLWVSITDETAPWGETVRMRV